MQEKKAKFIVDRLQHQAMTSVRMTINWAFICLFHQNMPNFNSYTVKMEINGKPCMIELDTAAHSSIISKSEYLEKFAGKPLTASKVRLKTYMDEVLDILDEMQGSIVFKGKQYYLPILVGDYDEKPTVLGKNWLWHIKLE